MATTPLSNATTLARAASQKAYASNSASGHKSASEAHGRAATQAFACGDLSAARQHRAIATKHTLKSIELGKREKDPKKGAKANVPDEPDRDGKVENPLKTWAGSS